MLGTYGLSSHDTSQDCLHMLVVWVKADLPEFEIGDLVIASLVLHLPEDLVQVQLLVGKDGHLVPPLGPPVPVDQQPHK